ncbi:hypothetical protein [Rufibacter sp. LB8]|uniref:hypothetical protein n=1 Tax=Rufibacter sp. LB8 TaxID=2777781 RepID=UPI00178C6CE4|nr:hypothetical protein [Rufibacter sp. LB8]
MINLIEEIYNKLLAITDSVHFLELPLGIDETSTQIVYEVNESASFNTLDVNNYANTLDLKVKIFNQDAATLIGLAEQVKGELLNTFFIHTKDIVYKSSVPIFQDPDLNTKQLTLLFTVYHDAEVNTPSVCLPVTILNPDGSTTFIPSGGSFTVPIPPPAEPVTITNPNDGSSVTVPSGGSYVVPVVPIPDVTIVNPNDGSSVTAEAGSTYTLPMIQEEIDLIFNYPSNTELSIAATVSSAATYTSNTLVNVGAVVYKKNGAVTALPFALIAGDGLTVEITKTNTANTASVTLKNY